MKQVLLKKGMVLTEDVPEPPLRPRMIKVALAASCISPGTETAGLQASGRSLLERTMAKPEKLKNALKRAATEGIGSVFRQTRARMEEEIPTGYSAAGEISALGEGVCDLHVGDRVAVAGALYAHHAESVVVPRNLAVRVPPEVSSTAASTVALGAIALQGVRRANIGVGCWVAVLGCGAIGLLAVQILRAGGCRVVAIDPMAARREKALALGADLAASPEEDELIGKVVRRCNGEGADAVIIAASTGSSEPLSHAFRMARRKGRVVLVGVVGPEYDRAEMYRKELDFVISTSYGPGRYDDDYEERGIDYPYGYVRWTEQRNMEAYLDLVARGSVDPETLIDATFEIEHAAAAYDALKARPSPVLVAFTYDLAAPPSVTAPPSVAAGNQTVIPWRCPQRGPLRVVIVGAGSFMTQMHVPNLLRMPEKYDVRAVVDESGVAARRTARLFPACESLTSVDEPFRSEDIEVVIIGTRHDTHARLAIRALHEGKAVFVEKPMCLSHREFEELKTTFDVTTAPYAVGYNRRFAPFVRRIKRDVQTRVSPVLIHYTVNAGYVSYDHWTQTSQGGGRILGEACHMFDLFRYLIGAPVLSVSVDPLRPQVKGVRAVDNLVAALRYADGSVASLLYSACGSKRGPKERMELFFDEKTYVLEDYTELSVYRKGHRRVKKRIADKGHKSELEAFFSCVIEKRRFPIPKEELLETWHVSKLVSENAQGR